MGNCCECLTNKNNQNNHYLEKAGGENDGNKINQYLSNDR